MGGTEGGGPAVGGPGSADGTADGDDRVREVKAGVDDGRAEPVAVGRAVEGVLPGVGALSRCTVMPSAEVRGRPGGPGSGDPASARTAASRGGWPRPGPGRAGSRSRVKTPSRIHSSRRLRMAPQRAGRIDRRPLGQQGSELVPQRAGQPGWPAARAQVPPVNTERRNSMIKETCARLAAWVSIPPIRAGAQACSVPVASAAGLRTRGRPCAGRRGCRWRR